MRTSQCRDEVSSEFCNGEQVKLEQVLPLGLSQGVDIPSGTDTSRVEKYIDGLLS